MIEVLIDEVSPQAKQEVERVIRSTDAATFKGLVLTTFPTAIFLSIGGSQQEPGIWVSFDHTSYLLAPSAVDETSTWRDAFEMVQQGRIPPYFPGTRQLVNSGSGEQA